MNLYPIIEQDNRITRQDNRIDKTIEYRAIEQQQPSETERTRQIIRYRETTTLR